MDDHRFMRTLAGARRRNRPVRGQRAAALLLMLPLTLPGCSATGGGAGEARREPDGRDHRKTASSISYRDRTRVLQPAVASRVTPGFDQERAFSGLNDWEPAVAADPHRPYVYQLTTRFEGPRAQIIFRRSTDSGATWEPDRPLVDTGHGQADPQIRVAADGTVFAACLDVWDTILLRSDDFGQTWSDPVSVAPSLDWTDHGWLAVAPGGQDVYVGLNMSDSFVVASHDGGQTFGPPVQTNSDSRYWFHTGAAVGPSGEVYVATADYLPNYRGETHVSVLRSVDGGASWQTIRLDTSAEAPACYWAAGCYYGFLGPTAAVAVDASGRAMVAYNAGRVPRGPQQLWVSYSDDGVTWSAPQVVSGGSSKANNGFPAIAAGRAAGDFRVVWQANADGDTSNWNTWYRRTQDGGATWSAPLRLSDLESGAPYKHEGGYLFPYGDYLGMDVDGAGVNHVIWGEGDSYNGPGGTWYTRGL